MDKKVGKETTPGHSGVTGRRLAPELLPPSATGTAHSSDIPETTKYAANQSGFRDGARAAMDVPIAPGLFSVNQEPRSKN